MRNTAAKRKVRDDVVTIGTTVKVDEPKSTSRRIFMTNEPTITPAVAVPAELAEGHAMSGGDQPMKCRATAQSSCAEKNLRPNEPAKVPYVAEPIDLVTGIALPRRFAPSIAISAY